MLTTDICKHDEYGLWYVSDGAGISVCSVTDVSLPRTLG